MQLSAEAVYSSACLSKYILCSAFYPYNLRLSKWIRLSLTVNMIVDGVAPAVIGAVPERLGHDKRERLHYKSEPLDHVEPADLCRDWCYLRKRGRPRTEGS